MTGAPIARRALFNRLRAANFLDDSTREALLEALAVVEREPLASAGLFPGDLVRCLMDLPPRIWRVDPALYARFRDVVRGAAIARRDAPARTQRRFWTVLPARVPVEAPWLDEAPSPLDAEPLPAPFSRRGSSLQG